MARRRSAGRRAVRVVVTGDKEIDRRLRRLAPRLQRKIARQAARAGLRPLHEAAVAEAPEDTGFLKDHIKLRAVRKKRRGEIALHVLVPSLPFKAAFGDRLSPKTPGAKTTYFYPSIIEWGSRDRPPNPWLRRIYERLGDRAKRIALDVLRGGIEREASRGVKQSAPKSGGGPRRDPTTGRFVSSSD